MVAPYLVELNSRNVTRLESLDEADLIGMNDAHQVVGNFSRLVEGGSRQQHAFVTGPDGTGMVDLGTLGGDHRFATAINTAGRVVGTADTVTGARHAFIKGPNGAGMTDLESFRNPLGISDAGQIVGGFGTSRGATRAFITGPNATGMADLGTLGGDRSTAYGLNNKGQVVGDSETSISSAMLSLPAAMVPA